MPEKPLTIATYAAGASLAAITLVYVFAPTYFIDSDPNPIRKRGVVGLTNPANDCFINSVLQALAGLTDLRVYLIRETHRRRMDDQSVYEEIVPHPIRKNTPDWKIKGLQDGIVTQGLKDMLDALNERPIYKKTISATTFVKVLEVAFRQRISRQQQDAQEFLQVVAERLCDEYHAGQRARQNARRKGIFKATPSSLAEIDSTAVEQRLAGLAVGQDQSEESQDTVASIPQTTAQIPAETVDASKFGLDEEEYGFPLEGKFESQIECQTCGFKPRPTENKFCTLTLNVPQASSTTLNACIDGMFKTEYVDDFKCEKCRLLHARQVLEAELARSNSESFKATTQEAIAKLQHVIDTDPERIPDDVVLPDMRYAPKRRIARHTRLTSFPKIMAIHLSRSIYDSSHMSTKNSAKVAFPERLALGGLLQQKKYKLLGTVTHKGSHHSGHYESFRRQNITCPFSTHNAFQQSGAFVKSAQPSPNGTPQIATPPVHPMRKADDASPAVSTPDLFSITSVASSLNQSAENLPTHLTDGFHRSSTLNGLSSSRAIPTSAPRERERDPDAISLRSVAASAKSTISKISHSARHSRPGSPASKQTNGITNGIPVAPVLKPISSKSKRKKSSGERWWRISDEKIKEAKTNEVLNMQREVYLLFYELERDQSPASTTTES